MECLDANTVQDLMAGALDSVQRGVVLGHLDTCAECRELLVISARGDVALGETKASDGRSHEEDEALMATVAPEDLKALESRPRIVTAKPATGKQFGRYEMTEKLGAGAMGVVWRALDPELGREVALKLLKRPDAALTDRLVREARSMAQVNHPNVVSVYDVGTEDGATYIAMELVEGKSLRQWQHAQTSRTVPEIVEAFVAAGRGLAAAHRAGLVHRDFKPDNVLVGNDGRIRVTDFGLAAAKPGESGEFNPIGDVNLTTSGSVLGTPAYMAPEQFAGGNVDSRTDQFNFCVALYEALYGERPFDGKTFEELGNNVKAGKMKQPNERVPVSPALRAILYRGMSVKPGDRYPTMDHLLAELARDRARPLRVGSWIAAAVAALLVFGLAGDYIVRSRAERTIRQAFAATGTQIERAGALQTKRLRLASALVDTLQAMYVLTGEHDESEFGLTSPEEADKKLHDVHDTLQSASWKLVRELGPGHIAVADRKGQLVYSSAAENEWHGSIAAVPAIAPLLAGTAKDTLAIVHYDDPAFVSAKVFGDKPPAGIALMFARAVERNGDVGGVFAQFVPAAEVLSSIRLDDDTELGLAAPDGTVFGCAPELARAAPPDGSVGDVTLGGTPYEVQGRPWNDSDGKPVARVVMAHPLAGVLSLFPHARGVFAAAALSALALALVLSLRARRLTGARV